MPQFDPVQEYIMQPSTLPPPHDRPAREVQHDSLASPAGSLSGRLGVLDIVLATLAFAGPLAGTTGYITVMIGLGNGIGTPMAFISVMAALLVFSVGYGAMTRFVGNPGAFYAYITAGLGRPVGLGSSFLILATYIVVSVGFYGFAGLVVDTFVTAHGGPQLPWWIYSLIYWAVVGTLAYFHVAVSAKVLGVLLILEVAVVAVFDTVIFSGGGEEGVSVAPWTLSAFTSGSLGIAFVFGIALFAGFESTAIYQEEVRDPAKTIPRATIITVLFIGVFYALTSWAFITALGTSQAVERATAEGAGAFNTVAAKFIGNAFVDIAAVLLLTSVFAAHLAIQNVATRYLYCLSVDGIMPGFLGKAHPRFRSPHRASIAVSVTVATLTTVLIIVGLTNVQIYTWLAGFASFTMLCMMAGVSVSAFVYFRRHKEHSVSRWQGVVAPALSFGALFAMVCIAVANLPALIGGSALLANSMLAGSVVIFVVGVVTSLIFRSKHPATYARIGRQ